MKVLLTQIIKGVFLCILLATIFVFDLTLTPAYAQNVDAYIEEFAEMAAETAAHFGGNVDVYEIWNEQDLHGPSSVYLSPEDYARLLAAAYSAIKGVSSSTVIVGGLASGDAGYLSRIAQASGGTIHADGIGVHPYAQYTSDAISNVLNNYLAVSQGKPLWITEFGWGTPNHGDQAAYFVMATATFNSFGGSVRAPTWYCWSDAMNPNFGLITTSGTRKPSYVSFPNGYGVNVDPAHPHPHNPTGAELQNLGAGWVRLVYRPKVDEIDFDGLIQEYKDAGLRVILILNHETLWTENLPGYPGAGQECVLAKGAMPISKKAPTPGAFAERDNECTGTIWGIITCWLRLFFQWAQQIPWHLNINYDNPDGLRAFWYKPRSTPNVPIFRIAQKALLRTVSGVRRVDGPVARMLPPHYRQDGTNVIQQLDKIKGQSSDALVVSNEGKSRGLSTGSGDLHMEFFGPGYEVTAEVPYIPVLKHKASLLTQGLVPGAPRTVIPRITCAPPIEDVIPIHETYRNIGWDLDESSHNEEEVTCEMTDPDDPDCNDIPDEEGEDGNCPCEGSGDVGISADLDTQTKVALTAATWGNIAGGSGFLDIIKPPRNLAFCYANAKTTAQVVYRSETMGDLNKPAGFPIRDLGGVGLAFKCVMNAMLMPPSTADRNACKDVLIEPSLLVKCTPPPPCWAGSPNDVEAERPGECPAPYNRCTGDYDWHIIPACTFKLDPDALEYTLYCYGNACRACDSPGIPPPSGCCGSTYTVPGSGASCANPAGTWWIPAGNFPGEVTYNGFTYTPPDDYPWSGVFICDSNEYGCGACTGGGTFYAPCKEEMIAATWTPASSSLAIELGIPPKLASYPTETETSGQVAGEVAPRSFSPRQNRKDNGGSFFITLADIIGGAIRTVLNL